MGNYRNDRFGGGGNRSFGGGSSYRGGRDSDRGGYGNREEKEMFKTVCDNCGKSCEVPFKPSGDKPVYCSDCFNQQRSDRGDSPRTERREFGGNDAPRATNSGAGNDKIMEQLNVLNAKFDKLLTVLESLTVDEDELEDEIEEAFEDSTPEVVAEEVKPVKEKKTRAKKADKVE